ncbi:c-type cytochrome [Sulfuriflexus sp.]|uniref:c-type cytochrome n=1 Tax=Sulfuriflexus sp. TaxID=2015443 RepID=UPI0028CFCD72|nr:c-type cytochrome [Sulfuriflexus sp.]MDT8404520.1 c-type cytochrome [Sulfuriflexus sp.]
MTYKTTAIDKSILLAAMLVATGLASAGTIDTRDQAPYEQCGYCHEYDGNSRMQDFPRLAGQRPAYLIKQLQDFRSGRRQGVMQATAELLSEQEIKVVAEYFSQQVPIPLPYSLQPAAGRQVAQHLFMRGDPARALPACVSCHLVEGEAATATPRLSGQHQGYLAAQLNAFKKGTRSNDRTAQMQAIANLLQSTRSIIWLHFWLDKNCPD